MARLARRQVPCRRADYGGVRCGETSAGRLRQSPSGPGAARRAVQNSAGLASERSLRQSLKFAPPSSSISSSTSKSSSSALQNQAPSNRSGLGLPTHGVQPLQRKSEHLGAAEAAGRRRRQGATAASAASSGGPQELACRCPPPPRPPRERRCRGGPSRTFWGADRSPAGVYGSMVRLAGPGGAAAAARSLSRQASVAAATKVHCTKRNRAF